MGCGGIPGVISDAKYRLLSIDRPKEGCHLAPHHCTKTTIKANTCSQRERERERERACAKLDYSALLLVNLIG